MAEKPKSKKSAPSGPDDAVTFEQALHSLEEVVERLEDKNLSLDEALVLFEKGVSLIRTCDARLKSAQGRVTELLKSESGGFVEKILGDTLDAFTAKESGNA